MANMSALSRPKLSETLKKRFMWLIVDRLLPAEEIGAKEHAEHVESAVDGALPLAAAEEGELLHQAGRHHRVVDQQVLERALLG